MRMITSPASSASRLADCEHKTREAEIGSFCCNFCEDRKQRHNLIEPHSFRQNCFSEVLLFVFFTMKLLSDRVYLLVIFCGFDNPSYERQGKTQWHSANFLLLKKPLKNAACLYQLFILSLFYCESREQLNRPPDSSVLTSG